MISDEFIVYCYPSTDYSYLSAVLDQLTEKIFVHTGFMMEIDFDVVRDSGTIYEQYIESQKENSLASRYPELAKQWHPDKNGFVTPDKVSYASGKVFWWKGECGHEWRASVVNRQRGNGCPICRGFQVLIGFNDLASTCPSLCDEWHPTKNVLSPQQITRGSDKKVWWLCPNGHEYQATVSNRVFGKGCPICAGKKIVTGVNDLATVNPQLMAEWDYAKNGELSPHTISPYSHKKAWWKCSCGNEWEAEIKSRQLGTGCPICNRRKKKP